MTTHTAPPPMRERLLDVHGRKIFVAETGDGPPVLLLHGGGPGASGVSNYTRNIAELAKEYRVIVPDLPGYGRSTKGVDGADPFGHLAAGIHGLLDELGLDQAHLVGNSYGGACALRLALDTPDRIDRMVLMGPGGIGTTRALPTPGLSSLLNYYAGDGPSRLKLEKFIRTYLVFNAADVPDSVIDARYEVSIDPEVIAAPPLRRPPARTRCARCGGWTSPATPACPGCPCRPWCSGAPPTRSTGPRAAGCWPTACPTAICTRSPTPGTGCSSSGPSCSTGSAPTSWPAGDDPVPGI